MDLETEVGKLEPEDRVALIRILRNKPLVLTLVKWLEKRLEFAAAEQTVMAEMVAKAAAKKPDPLADIVERIYQAYPKKIGRPIAIRSIRSAVNRVKDGEKLLELTIQYARIKAEEASWNRDWLHYVPNPSTWFNQDRFNDPPNMWKRLKPLSMDISNRHRERVRLNELTSQLRNMEDPPADLLNEYEQLQKLVQTHNMLPPDGQNPAPQSGG